MPQFSKWVDMRERWGDWGIDPKGVKPSHLITWTFILFVCLGNIEEWEGYGHTNIQTYKHTDIQTYKMKIHM
jgi:hypothetical protein